MTDRNREGGGAASREAILDAAEAQMAAHGFAGASISRIEKASGLPASSIYWHFGSKDGVLLAVMQRGADRFFASLPRAADLGGTPLERIDAALAAAASLLEEHPQFAQLVITLGLQHTEGDPAVLSIVREMRRRVRQRLEQALVPALDGVPEAERAAAAAELARMGLALTDGTFIASQIEEGVDLTQMFTQLGRLLAALVEARSAGAPG
ncbi:MAG TPA: TetR/AcrR family transcriptional regulator [Solirubrobacteraceae bacterium]|jgi:AcrR family transcriptional regulator